VNYAVITPAREEAENLPALARCLAEQELLPALWVIVDNGSRDATWDVAARLAEQFPWIRPAAWPMPSRHGRGATVVRAFHAGLGALEELPDVLVKLDADVTFEPDYFRRLLEEFERDPELGIASGSAWERNGRGEWSQQFHTATNVWGASRAYRRECLVGVLPLEEHMGWDGIDRLKAHLRGWSTRTILDLPFYHHRREGSRDGARARAWWARGDGFHYMGYRPSYVFLGALHHALTQPAALATIAGYTTAALRRKPTCPDPEVRTTLRYEQRLGTILARRREVLGKA
jgi:glycosyltransferase involved in cell wall biosynthesis